MTTRQNYRVTFHTGVSMVISFPGDLPRLLFDSAEKASASGSKPGFLLLQDPNMVLDISAVAVVHRSAQGAEAQA